MDPKKTSECPHKKVRQPDPGKRPHPSGYQCKVEIRN
jgi:hypothetical protein